MNLFSKNNLEGEVKIKQSVFAILKPILALGYGYIIFCYMY